MNYCCWFYFLSSSFFLLSTWGPAPSLPLSDSSYVDEHIVERCSVSMASLPPWLINLPVFDKVTICPPFRDKFYVYCAIFCKLPTEESVKFFVCSAFLKLFWHINSPFFTSLVLWIRFVDRESILFVFRPLPENM